jgi:hypothetical protein
MYALVLFQIIAWNQLMEVSETGPFDDREQCQLTMFIAAKLIEQKDPNNQYFFICRKI